MKKAAIAVLGAAAVAVPNMNAWAAATATPKTKTVVAKKSFTGALGTADRWGDVEVTIVVRKTTVTNLKTKKKKKVTRKITSVTVPVYPNHTDRSIFINQQALPILIQEATQAQFTGTVDMVSGATNTSDGFEQSLQSAILKAKAW